jgi:hypothetical protein
MNPVVVTNEKKIRVGLVRKGHRYLQSPGRPRRDRCRGGEVATRRQSRGRRRRRPRRRRRRHCAQQDIAIGALASAQQNIAIGVLASAQLGEGISKPILQLEDRLLVVFVGEDEGRGSSGLGLPKLQTQGAVGLSEPRHLLAQGRVCGGQLRGMGRDRGRRSRRSGGTCLPLLPPLALVHIEPSVVRSHLLPNG